MLCHAACTDETMHTEQYNITYAMYNIGDSDMIEVCSHYSKQASQYSDILVAMASLWLFLSVSTLHIAETTEQLSAKNVIYNTNSHMSCHHSVLKRHAHIAALQLRRQDREHRAAWGITSMGDHIHHSWNSVPVSYIATFACLVKAHSSTHYISTH